MKSYKGMSASLSECKEDKNLVGSAQNIKTEGIIGWLDLTIDHARYSGNLKKTGLAMPTQFCVSESKIHACPRW